MSNLFQEILNNPQGVKNKMSANDFQYYNTIKQPSGLGMSSASNLDAFKADVNGLTEYVNLIFSGNSTASKTGKPLGSKYFIQTGGKCMGIDSKKEEDRYIYINNMPLGKTKISNDLGMKGNKGLLPGAVDSLNSINPFSAMKVFLGGEKPPCQQITMETIDINNTNSSEMHYVATMDIADMNPCSFPDGVNPVTNNKCRQGFTNKRDNDNSDMSVKLPSDPIVQIYYAGLAGIGLYVLYRLMEKSQ